MKDSDVLKAIVSLEKALMARHIHPEKIATEYSEEFDCYYNPKTNQWTEPKCSDPECEYCSRRPERPL
jgi:hypothetical protein